MELMHVTFWKTEFCHSEEVCRAEVYVSHLCVKTELS